MGLRPHEVRDLIRRGLWPQHPTDEERGMLNCYVPSLIWFLRRMQ